ncbi:MAG: hypothetical protein HYR56_25045 [Acidobacteria bacterium]|nr:hypothetical protein [Acidobacteriota bacterium]MBI3424127.1 hypothetical protein [Acidobacteriota bacterium]
MLMITLFVQNRGSAIPAQQLPEKRREEVRRHQIDDSLRNASKVKVIFQGNRVFTSQELYEQMERSRNTNSAKPFALKTPFYSEDLQHDLEGIRFFLGTKGYLMARYTGPEVQVTENQTQVILHIEEGAFYRIGKLEVVGNRLFPTEQLIAMSGLKIGEPINVRDIQEKVFTGIRKEYDDHGYIQAEINFNPTFNVPFIGASVGVVDVELEVDEGRLFTIRSIGFLGVKKSEEELLRSQLFLHEGDVMRQNLLEASLVTLNQLGQFEEIRLKDVIVRTNSHLSTVDLDFQLSRKK